MVDVFSVSIIQKMYASQVSGALMFLETRLALGISSNYSLCLATYALTLANSESAERALAQLMGRAEMKGKHLGSWMGMDETPLYKVLVISKNISRGI